MKPLILASHTEEELSAFLMLLAIIGAVLLVIYITRALFSIPRFLKLKKAEVALLTILAKRDCSEEEKKEIKEIESNLNS